MAQPPFIYHLSCQVGKKHSYNAVRITTSATTIILGSWVAKQLLRSLVQLPASLGFDLVPREGNVVNLCAVWSCSFFNIDCSEMAFSCLGGSASRSGTLARNNPKLCLQEFSATGFQVKHAVSQPWLLDEGNTQHKLLLPFLH